MSNALTANSREAVNNEAILINALCHQDAYPHEIQSVKIIETHISRVLLTGDYVYKIKKPVNFGFLDFSTLAKRRFFCYEELRLNRRLSTDLYLDVVPIAGTFAHPKISGTGEVLEYAVRMKQFPAGQLLSEFAGQGKLEAGIIDQLAFLIADFHEKAEKVAEDSILGSSGNSKHWFDENFQQIQALLDSPSDRQQLHAIQLWGEEEWQRKTGFLELRLLQGFVREGHGDLHLSNITIIQGVLTPFDCLEFNPMLRWIDVLSDIAFLVVDLAYFGYAHYAYRFLNQYLQRTGDYSGLSVFRYYLVYRALVLAKVALLRKAQHCLEEHSKQRYAEYKTFVNLTEGFTKQRQNVLIITHGYSGAGKSGYASQLAEQLGAVLLRSDIERKRLFGYPALADTGSGLASGVYSRECGLKTYQRLAELAGNVLVAGFSVIIDATFLKREQREHFRRLAAEHGVAFLILDFQASELELCKRIAQRHHDASEATPAVLKQQQQASEPLFGEEWQQTIEVDTEAEGVLDSLLAAIKAFRA